MATIITKFSSTSSAVPSASDLVQGELAVNTADKRLFTENNSAVIIELGTNPSSITTGAITATGTVTANSNLSSSNAVLTGGTVNGVVVGGSTPQAITGTLITANTNFAGALVGNVTGNVTGNLTGNVTGDLTGNVTASSGTTTLNNLVLNGTVDFNAAELTDLATPTAASSAATKGYVDTEVAGLVDSAPGTLDTLNELAAALGDDPDFATTITNQIATKLALAGGTMTGAIAMGTNKITGLGTPTVSTDAATKAYADTMLPLAGGTMTGNIVLGSNKATSTATPSADDDLTRKGYVDSILGSATSAATSAANAATSESNAATSASNAATSESNAAASATNAANSYDSFDDRYLGTKTSDPALDNDGDALIAGALYFNTSSNVMKVYSGSSWANVAPTATSITLSQVSDVTATAAEVNVLDGIPATLTATELGYVDGVTSSIQTQLNAKQASDAQLTDIAGLTPSDSNFIVGNGSNFVTESGATARTSLGVSIGSDVQAYDSNLTSFVGTFTLPTSDGTANQVLTTNGSGTLSLADAGGGAWNFINSTTVSSTVASIDITSGIGSTYDFYVLQLVKVQVVNTGSGSVMKLRTSTNGGSSFDSSGYSYAAGRTRDSSITFGGEASASASEIYLTGSGMGATDGNNLSGFIYLVKPSDAANFYMFWDLAALSFPTSQFQRHIGGGQRETAADVDAIRIYHDNSINGGTVRLFGINNS